MIYHLILIFKAIFDILKILSILANVIDISRCFYYNFFSFKALKDDDKEEYNNFCSKEKRTFAESLLYRVIRSSF